MARRVFISYARRDGADVAQELYTLLKERGWLDTECIRGGASWGREIEKALHDCEVLLAVLTPSSYESEICRAEQIWALEERKTIIPVLAVPDAPVPVHLKSRNYRRYPAEKVQLLEDIGAEPVAAEPFVRALHYDTIPNLPQNYVVREGALADLRDKVFTEGAGVNIAVTAVAGMGGIGKTVLATALCRNPAVQRAFPDGIAWITIGREWDGDFITRMREVARALGVKDLSQWDNPEACKNNYRTILRDKAALVVVDDIWNVEHIKPFLVEARRSRFLFTTRDITIANDAADCQYSANKLSEEEARELLAQRSGKTPNTLPPEAAEIIHECGHLAAAIAQIGASLRGTSPEEWTDTLDALKNADISAIEERLTSGQQSFFKSLAVSLQAVPAAMQDRYGKLAVLLEDAPAPLVVLRTLWNVKEAEARRTTRYFVDRSLATFNAAQAIQLHDLQLDYVRANFKDQAALKLIHGAMRLSSHVIARRPEEFASQMVGRLMPHTKIQTIAHFTREVAEAAPRPWLEPLWASLHPPGTALIRTLQGHSSFVRGVALTADGRLAVSASWDNTLKVWDVVSGSEVHTLAGHSNSVNGVALTADGRLAVSASRDHTLKVWDVASGAEVRTLAGHTAGVNGVAVSGDGRLAVSASQDNTLKVWDVTSGTELRALEGHSATVDGVALTADGRLAVSASQDKTLKVWHVQSGAALHTLEGHSDRVFEVAVTADGRLAVSASLTRR